MMNLTDEKQLKALLQRHGFRFERSKGQNFLIDASVPERIAAACGADASTGVVEIGPGVGCLTQCLAQNAAAVLAYELDESLRPVLAETMAPRPNVRIEFADALRRDLRADADTYLPGLRRVFCANLPYNITTPVLTKVYEARAFETVTVMVQREVALRLCAAPGCGDYGAFSVFTQWYAEPELLFTVPPGAFMPPPKVTSAVVRLRMRAAPPVDTDETRFFRVVRAAFAQRRKTLINSLSTAFPKDRAAAAVAACGLPERARGEELSLPQFAGLTAALYSE